MATIETPFGTSGSTQTIETPFGTTQAAGGQTIETPFGTTGQPAGTGTAPTVTFTYPTPEATLVPYDVPADITGTITDLDGDFSTASFNIRDMTAALEWRNDLSQWVAGSGLYFAGIGQPYPNWSLDNIPLNPSSTYRVTVIAIDGAGNDTFATSTFTTAAVPVAVIESSPDVYPHYAPPSTSSPLRILYGNLRTGDLYGELGTVAPTTWTRVLNAAGNLTVTVPLDTVLDPDFEKKQGAIWVVDGTTVRKGGTWDAVTGIDITNNTATLVAVGFWDYFKHRHILSDFAVTDDASTIAAGVMSNAAHSIRLELAPNNYPLGALTRNYVGWKAEQIAKAVGDLAAQADVGFDHHDRYLMDDTGRPQAVWQPTTNRGRPRGLILELGANCDLASATDDATSYADTVISIGAGNNANTPINIQSDITGLNVPYEYKRTHSDVTDGTTLTNRGAQDLNRRRQPVNRPHVILDPITGPAFDEWDIGDTVELRGGHGLYDATGDYRIIAETSTADDTIETTLTLAPLALFR